MLLLAFLQCSPENLIALSLDAKSQVTFITMACFSNASASASACSIERRLMAGTQKVNITAIILVQTCRKQSLHPITLIQKIGWYATIARNVGTWVFVRRIRRQRSSGR